MATTLLGNFNLRDLRRGAHRRTSFLLDSKGTRVFPEFVRIAERPHFARGGFCFLAIR